MEGLHLAYFDAIEAIYSQQRSELESRQRSGSDLTTVAAPTGRISVND